MEKLTIFESILKVFKKIFSTPFFIELFVLTIALIGVLSFFSIKESKKGKTISYIIYFIFLLLLPIFHFSFFVKTIDTIVENFVEVFYFPSCYVYFAILLITDIDVLRVLIINKDSKNKKISNILNIVYFGVIQLLFFVSVRIVLEKNINVFERSQLYSDSNLVSFIQICSYMFWIRLGIRLIEKIINILTDRNFKKVKVNVNSDDKDISKFDLSEEKFVEKEKPKKEKNKTKEIREEKEIKEEKIKPNKKPKLLDITPEDEEDEKYDFEKKDKKLFYNFEVNENLNNPINNMKPITLITESNKNTKNKDNKEKKNVPKKTNTTIDNNDDNDKFFDDFYD